MGNEQVTPPKVSVVITAFNSERYLRDALDSVLCQKFRDFELIVIDDGSKTKAALDICREVEDESNSAVHYYYKCNGGPSSARNWGLSLSNGEFVAFLDADDLFVNCKLAIQAVLLDKLPADYACVIGCSEKFQDRREESRARFCLSSVNGHFDINDFLEGTLIIQGTPGYYLFKRSALNAVGGYDESLWNNEDFDLLVRLNRVFKIKTHEDLVFRQRIRRDSLSKANIMGCLNGAICFANAVEKSFPQVSQEAVSRKKQRAYFSAAFRSLRRLELRHYVWLVNKGFEIGPYPQAWRGKLAYASAKPFGFLGAEPAGLKSS